MEFVKRVEAYTGTNLEKFYKATLFKSAALLLGVNCLEPGQVQHPHTHEGQDKFYYVVEGIGRFGVGDEQVIASVGEVVWTPSGVSHGVENTGQNRLTLLVGIAPAP